MKFRTKPVIKEAIKWDNSMEALEALGKLGDNRNLSAFHPDGGLRIHTLEGIMVANDGDWVICGLNKEFYPCKPDIFEKTYEAVEE